MATITSAGSGLASATSTWTGGVVPVEGDKVIIAAGHVVTLDGTFTWGDDNTTATIGTAAVSVSGTLKASRTVSSSLTVRGLLYCDYATHAMDFGTIANPIPLGVTATLILNKHTTPAVRNGLDQRGSTTTAHWIKQTYCGYARDRGVKLASDASGSSVTLVAAPVGWQVGDEVYFFNTSLTGTVDQCESRTIASISGATVTLSSALTYTHKTGSPVCNLTSNVVIRSFNEVSGQMANPQFNYAATYPTLGIEHRFSHVRFQNLGNTGNNSGAICVGGTSVPATVVFVDDCVCFNDKTGAAFVAMVAGWGPQPLPISRCVAVMSGSVCYGGASFQLVDSWCSVSPFNTVGIASYASGCWFTGRVSGSAFPAANGMTYIGCTFSGFGTSIGGSSPQAIEAVYENCDCGSTFGFVPFFGDNFFRTAGYPLGGRLTATIKDCLFNSQLAPVVSSTWFAGSDNSEIRVINKNRDVLQQQLLKPAGTQNRENATKFRGTSSIAFTHRGVGKDLARTQSIPCANGATIRIVGYVRMDSSFWNAGDNNLPTVALTGLGATPVTFTASAAANNAWEQFDLSITNTSGADGNFVFTYTASAKTVTTGTVYFDGVPDSPFITKVRHYGFLFNETSPTREVNPYTVASESTAAAYTGTTINATTKRVTFGIGTADTLNKVYDYSQAWAVTNIDKEVPWQRAGALLSLTSGWTVVDPVISGVTWGGSVIEWNTPGAISGSFDSTTFRFNAAGTYDLSGGTFAGTINLTNTSGGGVIVIVLPSGIDYVNDDPGSITVEVAVESATASITNIVPGSRLQVYNVTTTTEMVNTIVTGTTWSVNYPSGTGYSSGDIIRVRLAWMDGITAKLPVQYQTISASGGWAILADQQDDEVYNYNAIDGDTCTEFSHDFLNVQVDVNDADNTTTVQRGYAWFISGQMTADGIRYFFGGITAEDTVNYRINASLVNLRIQNIKANSNLSVTGGNIYRTDDTDIFAPGASGSTASMRYGRAYTVRVGGGTALSPEESAKLLSLPSVSAVTSAIEASSVIAKEQTVVEAKNNAALAAALSA